MKSLFSKNNSLFRAGWVTVDQKDVRVIDSNERLNEKMEIWGQPNRNLDGYDAGDDDEFTGLNPEQVEGLFGDGGSVIKGDANSEDESSEAEGQDYEPGEQSMEDLSQELLYQAEERLTAARREAEDIILKAQADIDLARRNAFDEGSALGYSEGLGKAMGEVEAMKAELQEERHLLRQEYDLLMDELEPRFVEMITDIYEQVFKVEMKDRCVIVAHLVATAMRESGENKNFIIRVSPDDYPYIDAHRDEIRTEAAVGQVQIEIIKDQTLASGDCLIETGGGVFDAGFDTQLAGLNEKLRLLSYEKTAAQRQF